MIATSFCSHQYLNNHIFISAAIQRSWESSICYCKNILRMLISIYSGSVNFQHFLCTQVNEVFSRTMFYGYWQYLLWLFIICSLVIDNMFYGYLQYVIRLLTICSMVIDNMFNGYWQYVLWLLTICSMVIDNMFYGYWQYVLWLLTICSMVIDNMFSG